MDKQEKYEEALKKVNIVLSQKPTSYWFISEKIELLEKLNRKEELINFINELKEMEEYKTALDDFNDFKDLEMKALKKEFTKWQIKMCVKQCEKKILEQTK